MEPRRREILLDFLTSRQEERDLFGTPGLLGAWFRARGLLPVGIEPSEEDARQARRLRAALIGLGPGGSGGATLVQFAYEAQLLGELERFKACQSCGWCYYDTTKNRSRRWCDMALCGSREKVRAYRARKKAAELS